VYGLRLRAVVWRSGCLWLELATTMFACGKAASIM
jgi:hypothetical protein